ncbi:hypothetical protein KAH37_05130 [bacterium]|nr:hypothetical protein [bacterium]
MEKLVAKIAALLFVLSIISTAFFWLFLSDRGGLNETGEQAAALFISENYQKGDTVFPLSDWDLGFTRYLDSKVSFLSLRFHYYSAEQLKNSGRGGKRFFLISDKKGVIADILHSKKLNLLKLQAVGNGEVALVEPEEKLAPVLLDFSADIMKARRVYFSDKNGENVRDCVANDVWRCSAREWNHIGFHRAIMGGISQDAVWAHPLSRKILHIVFAVPKGAVTMKLNTAFLETAYRNAEGNPIEVTLLVDGKEAFTYINQNENRLFSRTISLPLTAQEVELQFFVESDGARHFVFNGFMEGR